MSGAFDIINAENNIAADSDVTAIDIDPRLRHHERHVAQRARLVQNVHHNNFALAVGNTGLLESGDSLRGTAMRMGVPLLCLVTYRGYHKLPKESSAPDVMTRAEVDSVAVVTEPTLDAWRVPYELYGSDDNQTRIAHAAARAEARLHSRRGIGGQWHRARLLWPLFGGGER